MALAVTAAPDTTVGMLVTGRAHTQVPQSQPQSTPQGQLGSDQDFCLGVQLQMAARGLAQHVVAAVKGTAPRPDWECACSPEGLPCSLY
jgi:hypothetical protein